MRVECGKLLSTFDGTRPFFAAAEEGEMGIAQLIIESKAHQNQSLATDGTTPFFMGAFNGHLDVVQCLVQSGAQINKGTTHLDGEKSGACRAAFV